MKRILNFGSRILDFRSPHPRSAGRSEGSFPAVGRSDSTGVSAVFAGGCLWKTLKRSLLPGFLVGAVLVPVGLYADSGLLLSREFHLDLAVPEGGELLNVQAIDYGDAAIFDVKIGLFLSGDGGPMVNGDWYAGLGYGTEGGENGYAVLLNRIGKTEAWLFGSLDDGFDVVFDDNAPDIHFAGEPGGGTLAGVWSPSGRESLPENVGDTDPRTAMLSSFDGRSGVGEFRLLLSHEATGGAARLNGWSYEMNVVADPAGTLRLSTGDTVRTAGAGAGVGADVRIEGVVDFAAAGDVSVAGSLTGNGTLRQTGAGTLILSEEGDFSGIVSVTRGNLRVTNPTGSATGSAAVTVSEEGFLSGTGRIGGPVSVFGGGRISPGLESEIGQLVFGGDFEWGAGGIYVWKIGDALGEPGAGWDWIDVGGTLSITADAENPFLIQILALNLPGEPGVISGFDGWTEYIWTIATAGSLSGFDPTAFEVDASDFVARNPAADGTFSVVQSRRGIAIHYAPIPEPRVYAVGAGVMVLLFALIRCRRLRKR